VETVRIISHAELAKHTGDDDIWIAIHGKVYDVTTFLPLHPGSAELMRSYAGEEADLAFDMSHTPDIIDAYLSPEQNVGFLEGSEAARANSVTAHLTDAKMSTTTSERQLKAQKTIKNIMDSTLPGNAVPSSSEDMSSNPRSFLNGDTKLVKLIERTQLSARVYHLCFELPDNGDRVLGVPAGKHLCVHVADQNERATDHQSNGGAGGEGSSEISRKFTPAVLMSTDGKGTRSEAATPGSFDLVVRLFPADEGAGFADGGIVSQYVCLTLPLGGSVAISGPRGMHEYLGHGKLASGADVAGRTVLTARSIAMLAGSTGMPQMVRILDAALSDLTDPTTFSLVCHAPCEEALLLRETIDRMSAMHPHRLRVWYTVDASTDSATWGYSIGEINEEMMLQHLPRPVASGDTADGEQPLVLMCGPAASLTNLWQQWLDGQGYPKHRQLVF
jgi:NAD(P)H-flavin reductase/predicted heme/steroid binding protein